jgi:hypothetical protein
MTPQEHWANCKRVYEEGKAARYNSLPYTHLWNLSLDGYDHYWADGWDDADNEVKFAEDKAVSNG